MSTPKLYQSAAAVGISLAACSGAMNAGVPETVPSTLSPSTDASAAMPKSTSTTRPLGVTRMFDGFEIAVDHARAVERVQRLGELAEAVAQARLVDERVERNARMLSGRAQRRRRRCRRRCRPSIVGGTSTPLVIAAVERSAAVAAGARHPGGRT